MDKWTDGLKLAASMRYQFPVNLPVSARILSISSSRRSFSSLNSSFCFWRSSICFVCSESFLVCYMPMKVGYSNKLTGVELLSFASAILETPFVDKSSTQSNLQ